MTRARRTPVAFPQSDGHVLSEEQHATGPVQPRHRHEHGSDPHQGGQGHGPPGRGQGAGDGAQGSEGGVGVDPHNEPPIEGFEHRGDGDTAQHQSQAPEASAPRENQDGRPREATAEEGRQRDGDHVHRQDEDDQQDAGLRARGEADEVGGSQRIAGHHLEGLAGRGQGRSRPDGQKDPRSPPSGDDQRRGAPAPPAQRLEDLAPLEREGPHPQGEDSQADDADQEKNADEDDARLDEDRRAPASQPPAPGCGAGPGAGRPAGRAPHPCSLDRRSTNRSTGDPTKAVSSPT